MSYEAIIARVHTKPFPNADRLLLGTVKGYQVIVGIGTNDGELGIFFPSDGQLSEQFANAWDLVGYHENGEKKGGYFAKNRRVRAVKLRGEKSDGFWCPLSYLAPFGDVSGLKEGDKIVEFNGTPICNKYVTPETYVRLRKNRSLHRSETKMFRMNPDYEQFRLVYDEIDPINRIIITEKVHGTSHRYGRVLDEKQGLMYRLKRWFTHTKEYDWAEMSGTRRVIIKDNSRGYYADESFREEACRPFVGTLHKGETIYFEIVGYAGDQPIMTPQPTDKLRDKEYKKRYGDLMEYRYGCAPGECDVYVYRITLANEDGYVLEYPWHEVEKRCAQLDVKTVPFLSYSDNDIDLYAHVDSLVTGPSTVDQSHIREGVVVRVESNTGTDFYKHKSFEFGVLEGYLKEKDDYVDMEEAS